MNAIILRGEGREDEGDSDVDAWHHLAEVAMPVTVACGEFDVPFIVSRSRELAGWRLTGEACLRNWRKQARRRLPGLCGMAPEKLFCARRIPES